MVQGFDIGGGLGNIGQQGGGNQQGELRHQKLEIKNIIPLDIYEALMYAGYIESALVYGEQVQKRHVQGFHQNFWQVYQYVKNSVDPGKLDMDLIEGIDLWFENMRGQSRNTELILVGVELFLEFVKILQNWGIGRLFEKGIDPSFMFEDMSDFDMIIEDADEEVMDDDEDNNIIPVISEEQ